MQSFGTGRVERHLLTQIQRLFPQQKPWNFSVSEAGLSRQTPDGIPEPLPGSQIRPIREAKANVALGVGCCNPFQGTGGRFVNNWLGELESEEALGIWKEKAHSSKHAKTAVR
jgi:hypothetical protein